jgi:hypothetical protein
MHNKTNIADNALIRVLNDSEIDLYVTQWLRTANQQVSFGWWLRGPG